METTSSKRSKTFDFGTGIQPAHIWLDDEEEDEDTSNEMQGFGGIDPSSGSCSATLPNPRVDLTVLVEGVLPVHH